MGITTKEIAKICGVSRTTVHRALNNTGRISEKTKRMILETAEKNGYRPDLLATGLAKGKTYYVRIASYKKIGSTKILSNWSKVKKVKIRK